MDYFLSTIKIINSPQNSKPIAANTDHGNHSLP